MSVDFSAVQEHFDDIAKSFRLTSQKFVDKNKNTLYFSDEERLEMKEELEKKDTYKYLERFSIGVADNIGKYTLTIELFRSVFIDMPEFHFDTESKKIEKGLRENENL